MRQSQVLTNKEPIGALRLERPASTRSIRKLTSEGKPLAIDRTCPLTWAAISSLRQKLAVSRLVHYRLTEENHSLSRALLFLLTAHLHGARTILEVKTDIEPYLESGLGVLLKWLVLLADRTVVGSELKKSRLAALGVEADFVPIPISSASLRTRTVSQVVPSILSIGPLERTSNHSAVIRAFKQVKQKYPRAELLIIGNGSLGRELKELADSSWMSSVTFQEADNRESIVEALSNCDVVVDGSCHEELKVSSRLAMAAGLPIIKARCNGTEAMVEDGVNGLLYPLNDQSILADRILSLVEDPALTRRLSTAAAERFRIVPPDEFRRFWESIYKTVL